MTTKAHEKTDVNFPPKPVDMDGDPYPDVLDNEYEIADYIACLSTHYVDEEMVQELYRNCRAVLTLIAAETLTEGHPDANIPSAAKERKYAKRRLKTLPPLFVENGKIRDGNHRFRARRSVGQQHFWCYVVE